MSVGAIALAAVLLTYADPDGSNCRPGDERIRRHLGVTRKTVIKWRGELLRAGLLKCDSQSSGGRGGRGSAAVWRPVIPVKRVTPGSHDSEKRVTPEVENVSPQGDTTSPLPPHVKDQVGNQAAGSGPPPELIEFVIGYVHERTGKTITRTDADRCIRIKFDEYGAPPPAPRHYLGKLIEENPDWWLTGR